MYTDIIQQNFGNVLSFEMKKLISKLFSKNTTFSDLVWYIRNSAFELGRNLVSTIIEIVDEALAKTPRVLKLYRVKTKRHRVINTQLGVIEFDRTYYINKQTGKYYFLLDALLGIEKYRRIDLRLRVKLCQFADSHSYQTACNLCHNVVSKTSVMNFLREIKQVLKDEIIVKKSDEKPPKVLYIEGDEDHVKYQDGSSHYEKMIYIHEGYKRIDKNRRVLINPYCIIGSYSGSDGNEMLWDNVSLYIKERYGEDALTKIKIYFTSDAGKWLRTCSDWLNVVEVLDKFHIVQACRRAVGGEFKWNKGNNKLKEWVFDGNWEMVETFKLVYLSDPILPERRLRKARKQFNYLLKNQKYIDNIRNDDYDGDSTEAHISHWLAARDSSRPSVWSKEGLDSVMFIRCCRINKVDIYEEYCRKQAENRKKKQIEKFDKRINKKTTLNSKYVDKIHTIKSENVGIQILLRMIGNEKMVNV
ncbi:ISLre2 family transposase [Ligilactobacillus salivarius]|uniref:ISLre2 family transposase n=1 Tax=Ligilactobacillus salivarius TaxID=1624 RepID=UPI003F9636A0